MSRRASLPLILRADIAPAYPTIGVSLRKLCSVSEILISLPAKANDQCQTTVVSETISPAGNWIATIRQVYCEDALSSGVTEIVQLSRKGQALEKAGEVLADDDGANPAERPVLSWTSDTTLQIDVPNLSYLGRYKSEYQGVSIILRYNPDDPAAREIFYKKYGVRPP